jgi:hypothetical protein
MKLIKTVELNFGNKALADWEQECEKINTANDTARNNLSHEEIDGWEAREVFDAKWSDDGKERVSDHVNIISCHDHARHLGLDFSFFPIEGSARIKNFLVEKKRVLVVQEVELQELPPKPVVNVLSKLFAWDIIKSHNPDFDLQSYELGDHFWQDGKKIHPENFYTASHVFNQVIKSESFWRDLGEEGKLFVISKYYRKEIYRVYPDRFEIWETQVSEEEFYSEEV